MFLSKFDKKDKDKDKEKEKEKDKDKSFVNKLLEDITVSVMDVQGSIRFLSTDRLSDGPSISFNLASLMLRSTDSNWNVVDLAKLHEIQKGAKSYCMYKEIFVGSLSASVRDPFHPYVDFVRTQPMSLRVKKWEIVLYFIISYIFFIFHFI